MRKRYVGLLRGINVGGRNLIRMADLTSCLEGDGFEDVTTYIQSGNVLFTSAEPQRTLEARLERLLSASFGYQATVVLRSARQMNAVVEDAPNRFGALPATYRCNAIFLKGPATAAAAIRDVPVKEGVDEVWTGSGVLYFRFLIAKASASGLARFAGTPLYKSMTIRNWNTTLAISRLLDG